MKNHIIGISLALISMAVPSTLRAQDAFAYGVLTTRPELKITDMLNLSQYNEGFSTARSSAMGGAFTSLGADLSSISLNPAGLGMYRTSEFGFTQAVTITQSKNSHIGGTYNHDNSRTRYAINNMSLALNLYQGSGALTSFTMGIGYNRLADFNYRSTADLMAPNQSSIADVFSYQLRGINSASIEDGSIWRDGVDMNKWGAILGYNAFLVDPALNNQYTRDKTINRGADVYHYLGVHSRGRVGEYSFAGGFNFRNLVYLGFGIGIQDIYLKQAYYYEEHYDRNTSGTLSHMFYDQYLRVTGTAVNFKFGITAMPVTGLRLGVAVHTPSFVSMDKRYEGAVATFSHTNSFEEDYLERKFSDDFNTPTRLMAGASYTFGGRAIISFDYERRWYNGMRLSGEDVSQSSKDWYKHEVKSNFKGSNIFRVGAEVLPHPMVALRAGYAHYGSMLKNENLVYDDPVNYKTQNISAGLGFRFNHGITLDLSYIFMDAKFTDYDLYYYDGINNDGLAETVYTGGISSSRKKHNILLSLGYKF